MDEEPEAPEGRIVISSAPHIRAVYWCDFWKDALRPEFYKNRPVIVISKNNSLRGPVSVIPITTKNQPGNKWAHKLSTNPNPKKLEVDSWAVCNHVYTVSCSRLTQMAKGSPKIEQADFDHIVRLFLSAMPSPLKP